MSIISPKLHLLTAFFSLFLLYYQIAALLEHCNATAARADSIVGTLERTNTKHEDNSELLPPRILHVLDNDDSHQGLTPPAIGNEFHIECGCEVGPSVEHQFIPYFSCKSPLNTEQREMTDLKNLSRLRDEPEEDLAVSLQLGERATKRRKQSDSPSC